MPSLLWAESACDGVSEDLGQIRLRRGVRPLSWVKHILQLFLRWASSCRKPRSLGLRGSARSSFVRGRAELECLFCSSVNSQHEGLQYPQMSQRNVRHSPGTRDRAQRRLSRLTRLAAFAATGVTALIGVVVAHERPGSSSAATTATVPSIATVPSTSTTLPTSTPQQSSGSNGVQSSSNTQSTSSQSTTTTTSPPPTTTTTRPVATSGATSR